MSKVSFGLSQILYVYKCYGTMEGTSRCKVVKLRFQHKAAKRDHKANGNTRGPISEKSSECQKLIETAFTLLPRNGSPAQRTVHHLHSILRPSSPSPSTSPLPHIQNLSSTGILHLLHLCKQNGLASGNVLTPSSGSEASIFRFKPHRLIASSATHRPDPVPSLIRRRASIAAIQAK